MSTEPQNFTVIGTGAIAAVVVADFVDKNRKTKGRIEVLEQELYRAEEDKKAGDEIERLKNLIQEEESKIIRISVLGKGDSESYQAFKNGVTVNLKHVDENGNETAEAITFNEKDLDIITTDASEIKNKTGEQDHIFVAIKRYSYDENLYESIDELKKEHPEKGQETSVILGHNGLQCWLDVGDGYLDEAMYERIGKDNVHGCVINMAATRRIEDGKVVCDVSTPIGKINMPISNPTGESTETLKNLNKVFDNSYIPIKCPEGIKKEMFEKLKISVAINALTTLLNCAIGGLFNDNLYKSLVQEFDNFVGQHYQIPLRDEESFQKRLNPVRSYYPSTMRDFFAGKSIEFSVYEEIININGRYPEDQRTDISTIEQVAKILRKAVEIRGEKIEELKSNFDKDEKLSDEDIKNAAIEAINDKSLQRDISNLRNMNLLPLQNGDNIKNIVEKENKLDNKNDDQVNKLENNTPSTSPSTKNKEEEKMPRMNKGGTLGNILSLSKVAHQVQKVESEDNNKEKS